MLNYVKLIGGILILWIAVKLFIEVDPEDTNKKAAKTIWQAFQIIVAAPSVLKEEVDNRKLDTDSSACDHMTNCAGGIYPGFSWHILRLSSFNIAVNLYVDERPLYPSIDWLMAAFILRGLKEFGEPTRKALIMDLSPDHCKAGMFGLYYLIRDVFVSLAALGGAFLWQISPQTNLITAFVCGIIGTLGFAIFGRDVPLPDAGERNR